MSKVTHIVPPAGSLTEGEPDPTADKPSTSETSGTPTSDQISGPRTLQGHSMPSSITVKKNSN